MGWSLTWLAFPKCSAAQVHALLDLAPTGKTDEVSFGKTCGIEVDGGYIVHARGHGHALSSARSLERLSADGDVVAVQIEEHVMASSAELWSRGHRVWRVEHESERGREHLAESGRLPAEYAAIKQRLLQEQTGDDEVDHVFDVPLELARRVVGYRHDEDEERIHAELAPRKRGFLARVFGRS